MAVALFGTRTSPRAEYCLAILVAEIVDGVARAVTTVDGPVTLRASTLEAAGVDVLLCGGIAREAAELLGRRGIRVVSDLHGEAEELLRRVAAGDLPVGDPSMSR